MSISTEAVDKVVAPKAAPSKPLHVSPSSCTAPARFVPVSPLPNVTSISNRTVVPIADTNPELALTVFWNDTNPVTPEATVNAAPLPSPKPATAVVKLVVPSAVPPAIVKSWPFPAKAEIDMLPPLEFKLTGPPDSRKFEKLTALKLDQFNPSSVNSPAMLVETVPPNVTSPSNCNRLVAAELTTAELAENVSLNHTKPVTPAATVSAAPDPSPKLLAIPETVVVPAPIPAAKVKSRPPPTMEPKAIDEPFEFNE